ncbi:MAG: hypothetical protein A2X36_10820 [Elusimicrobia bacterium GWA2_69_24]|nr:MAG: hypothetical protein A2X36_10820 [Elusimicrobia bacterium GWA2_69_24]HBL18474.1 hypothetical protein [Elusimicrobiota bacterium]
MSFQERDERFWREQEGRLTRQIGQPCCSLAGMGSLLIDMPGNFAVVLHGEADCANSFRHTQGPSGTQFYTTRLTQVQFASGQTAQPLRRCLELLIREKAPDAVFVLGNCLMEMIHDDFETVAAEVSRRTGTPVVALRTHGLEAGSQAQMVDWLYSTLASLQAASGTPAGKKAKSLNLIGLPRFHNDDIRLELEKGLAAAGLAVNGRYPFDTALKDWLTIGDAEASFVVDRSLFPKLIAKLEALGQDCVEIPLPIGLGPTQDLLKAVGGKFSCGAAIEKALAGDAARARRRLKSFRSRFGGLRAAVGLRMVNNYMADQLAYDGLGDLPLFLEAGFEVALFIQGPPEEKAREHFRRRLESLGCRLPFTVFPDPFDLPPLLKAGEFDVAYLAGHARGEARRAGVPLIPGRSLEPFYAGAVRNLDYLEQVLDEIHQKRSAAALSGERRTAGASEDGGPSAAVEE